MVLGVKMSETKELKSIDLSSFTTLEVHLPTSIALPTIENGLKG